MPGVRKRGLLASVLLFVVACCLPALEFKNSSNAIDVMLGARALAVGWSGVFAAVTGWYANPFWLLGLALAVFGRSKIPGDEGDVTKSTVVQLLPGFYVWMASLVILPVAAFFGGNTKNVQKYQDPV